MKLFGKLFAGILTIIVLSFGSFGTVLLQSSFHSSLDREKERALEEMRMFQYAFLTSLDGLSGSNYVLTEETVQTLAESIGQNMGNSSQSFAVFTAEEAPEDELLALMQEEKEGADNCVWRIAQDGDAYFVETLIRMDSGGQTYYLKLNRDITYVYESRETLYRNYLIALLLLGGTAALFSALLAVSFTRPIYRLSQATRAFSEGDYGQRVTVKGNDELALLMKDFNRMADQLQENIQKLYLAARRQEEFTGAFAHELKTPLTAIIGYGQMLRTMELPAEERRLAADYIYREGHRLERLSYKMLELIELGNEPISKKPIPMQKWGEAFERQIAVMLAEKQLHLSLSFEEGTVCGDWELLLTLFGNLADNARKACQPGGEVAVTGSLLPDGSYQVRVSDNGCGMPKEEIDKITEAFYRIDKSRSRKEGGVGLGMAICERIVTALGATWDIESTQGEGTQITVVFPPEEEDNESKD